VSLKSSKWYSK